MNRIQSRDYSKSKLSQQTAVPYSDFTVCLDSFSI
jgi:hypothetical protein